MEVELRRGLEPWFGGRSSRARTGTQTRQRRVTIVDSRLGREFQILIIGSKVELRGKQGVEVGGPQPGCGLEAPAHCRG